MGTQMGKLKKWVLPGIARGPPTRIESNERARLSILLLETPKITGKSFLDFIQN
jgi:hypothetical protein